MSRTIEIRGLSDAQCDALADEAKARGVKFFDHCRDKLLAGTTLAQTSAPPPRLQAPRNVVQPQVTIGDGVQGSGADRIDRIEGMMMQMAEAINRLAHPGYAAEQAVEQPNIDVDDVAGQALAEADRQGMAVVEREPVTVAGGVRHVGTRKPMPLTMQAGVPAHLRGL